MFGAEFSRVPNLPMVMCDQVPEPAQHNCQDGDAQRGNIAFQKRLEELPSPGERIGLHTGGERQQEPATHPAAGLRFRAQISEAETFQGGSLETASKSLRRLLR